MRIKHTVLILGLACVHVFASGNAQSVTLHEKNASLEKVLKEIKKQTGFIFWYEDNVTKETDRVTVSIQNATVKQTMDALLRDLPLSYSIIDKTVVIKKKENVHPENSTARPASLMARPSFEANTSALTGLLAKRISGFGNAVKDIRGKVTDDGGMGLPGVNIVQKGTQRGTTTDVNGNFNIDVTDSSPVLIFSFVGYISQEIPVIGNSAINITLKVDSKALEEVVVVGYGTQKSQTVTGSIATVKGDEIAVAPIASTSNTLAGRLPGLISVQASGIPGGDAASLSIRGFGAALVIVDGVEVDFNTIDPNSIESISILKDAAASIYGSRAGNGVILVTTKRGNNEKPTITFGTSQTLQGVTITPRPVNAGQYAEMQSEQWLNQGKPAAQVPYTPEQIQKYYEGADPYLYPNTNWYNELIRDWAHQQQHNLSVRGGSEKIKYYGFLGYLDQKSMWKKSGGEYKRYNFQSNIDAQILDNLSLRLDLTSTIENRYFPTRAQTNSGVFWQDFWNTLPVYPASFPDKTKPSYAGYAGVGGAHISSNSDLTGYNDKDDQNIRGAMTLNYSFKSVKGLSAKAFFNYNQSYNASKTLEKPVTFYNYDQASDTYTLAGSLGSKASLNQLKGQSRIMTEQLSLAYDNTFGANHHVTALGLYEAIDYKTDWISAGRIDLLSPLIEQLFAGSNTGKSNDGLATEMGRKSWVGRLNYTFKGKYLFESSIRADASAKFPSNTRWGYFPSVSLGWLLSEENFISRSKTFDLLKIRASYGLSGNDAIGNFQYLSGFGLGGSYILDGKPQTGLTSRGLENPYLTWEKIKIYNFGTDFQMLNRKMYGSIDVFYRERSGIPATRITTLPSSFGANLPPENLNSLNDRGFEFKLGTAGNLGELKWDISGNVSWSRSKWGHYEEPLYTDPDQARINRNSGHWTDRSFGYLSEGLFSSKGQIDGLPFDQDGQGNVTLRPGDMRYKDVNADGKLDWRDQVEIGKGTIPHWMLGLSPNLKFKSFDLSALLQGAMGYYKYVELFSGKSVAPEVVYDLRWTAEKNDPNAFIPRLGGASSNGWGSDHWYKKAGYVRLKSLSLGYNIPKKLLETLKLKQVRIYVAGTNLLTISGLNKYSIDPESLSGKAGYNYPQQKTISLGANISL